MKKIINKCKDYTERYFVNNYGEIHGIYRHHYNVNNLIFFETYYNNGQQHGIKQRTEKKIGGKRMYVHTIKNYQANGVYINFK